MSFLTRVKVFLWKWLTLILSLGFFEGYCVIECGECGCPFRTDETEEMDAHICWVIDTDEEIN
jgi:hypothetical protein